MYSKKAHGSATLATATDILIKNEHLQLPDNLGLYLTASYQYKKQPLKNLPCQTLIVYALSSFIYKY